VADRLTITEDTVKALVKSILSKLIANDRTYAVTIAVKRGIIDLEGARKGNLQHTLLGVSGDFNSNVLLRAKGG
jgi:hypothetical protein